MTAHARKPVAAGVAFVALLGALSLGASSSGQGLTQPPSSSSQTPGYVLGEALVRFARGTSGPQRDEALATVGAHRLRRLPFPRGWVVEVSDVQSAVSNLEKRAGVEYAEANVYLRTAAVTNDPLFTAPHGGQAGLRAIRAPKAWRMLDNPRGKVVVAVADTGLALDHPDLRGAVWLNRGEAFPRSHRSNGLDDDKNGYIDDWRGWDFAPEGSLRFCQESTGSSFLTFPCLDRDGDRLPDAASGDNDPFDLSGHGTHVAGLIGAATNNRLGIASVGRQHVRLMPLRTGVDQLSAEFTAKAVAYARRNGADIVNLSLSVSDAGSQTLTEAIERADDTLIVAAAGNGAVGADNDDFSHLPCTIDESIPDINNLVCVAASDPSGRLAEYSNYGRQSVDLLAPGSTLSAQTSVRRSRFSEDFEKRFHHRWRTGGVNGKWGLERSSGDSDLSSSPNTSYPERPIDSWAQSPLLRIHNRRGCIISEELQLDTQPREASERLDDYLSLEVLRRQDVLDDPTGVAVGTFGPTLSDRIYVTNGSKIHVFADNGNHMATLGRNRDLGRLGDVDLPSAVDGPPPPPPLELEEGPDDAEPDQQVWAAGSGSSRVYRMDTDGRQLLRVGEPGSEIGQFDHPTGIAVAGGRVYVADTGNDRVQVLSTDGTVLDVWSGFDHPLGLDVDPEAQRVYVADAAQVQVRSTSGVKLDSWVGSGAMPLFRPRDIAVGPAEGPIGPIPGQPTSTFYVTDSGYNRTLVLDDSGKTVETLGGADETTFNPVGIDRALEGSLWVATSTGVLGYDARGRLSNQIRRWGVEVDVRAGRYSGPLTAEIPPGLGGDLYLRFRFLNGLSTSGNPNGPYSGAHIDNLRVRCATSNYNTAYGFDSGTSFAAPLVSGVAALYMARYPHADVSDVVHALERGTDDRPVMNKVAWGSLDAPGTLKVGPR